MTTADQNAAVPPKIRLGRISFINVDPIYYGFEHHHLSDDVKIVSAPPADLNRMLAEGALDISAVSSAAYGIHHKDWRLLPGFSIACSGDVMSVLLVGRVPLDQLHDKKVLVTDDSATAVRLMRLMFFHKGISPRLETRKILSPSQVDDDAAAALVIGDAALRHDWKRHFDFVWDLGDLWARHANLPFVFAVWAVRKAFADAHPDRVSKVLDLLHTSRRMGLSAIDTVVDSSASKLAIDPEITRRYFHNFCYNLDTPQHAGLGAFFDDLHTMGILKEKVTIRLIKTGAPAMR
jgi:chorismate dehydratase